MGVARAREDALGQGPRCVDVNRPALLAPMAEGNVEPVRRQQGQALVRPFDGRDGLPRKILDDARRFELTERGDAIPIHVGERQAAVVFMNDDEGRTGHGSRRGPEAVREAAHERGLAGPERSVEGDRFAAA